MDYEEAHRLLHTTEARRETIRDEITALATEERALSKIIEGLGELYPDLLRDHEPTDYAALAAYLRQAGAAPPRGAAAADIILKEHPGDFFGVPAMTAMLASRGWLPVSDNAEAAVRAALDRLVASDAVHYDKRRFKKDGRMAYRFIPDGIRGEVVETS